MKPSHYTQFQELKSRDSALLPPNSGGQCENILPPLRDGCSGFPELLSFALQPGGLFAAPKKKAKCGICPPWILGAGALRNIPPTHLPLHRT